MSEMAVLEYPLSRSAGTTELGQAAVDPALGRREAEPGIILNPRGLDPGSSSHSPATTHPRWAEYDLLYTATPLGFVRGTLLSLG